MALIDCMKKSFLILAILALSLTGRTQSFEGVISYSVKFELKEGFLEKKDQIFEKLKKDGDYYDTLKVFIKNSQYKKIDNSANPKSVIYAPEQNTVYVLEAGFDHAVVIDASKVTTLNLNLPEPSLHYVDSIKHITNVACDILKLSWDDFGEEWYFFNKDVATIDPKLFENHNYNYLNTILNSTGSYPLEIVKSLDGMMSTTMSLVSIEEKELSDELFKIPELKKANKKMNELMGQVTGTQVMKIKN